MQTSLRTATSPLTLEATCLSAVSEENPYQYRPRTRFDGIECWEKQHVRATARSKRLRIPTGASRAHLAWASTTMLLKSRREDEDIIKVYQHVVVQFLLEQTVHHSLKCRWSIRYTKRHHHKFKMSPLSPECRLGDIFFSHSNLVVSKCQIQGGEVLAFPSLSNKSSMRGNGYRSRMVCRFKAR